MADNKHFIQTTLLKQLPAVILAMLLVQLCGIGNTIIAGNLISRDGLATMSVVNPVFFTYSTLGSLVCVGGAMLAAYYVGKNDQAAVNGVFTLSLLSLAVLGLLISLLGLAGMGLLLRLLGVPESLKEPATAYLRVYLLGGPGAMGIYLPFNYLKLIGRQRASVLLFLLMAVVNISLDLLFILKFDLGLAGLALATVISLYAAFGLGLLLLCGPKGAFTLTRVAGRGKDLLQLLKMGSPAAMNNFCNVLRVLCLNLIFLSALGKNGLTVFSMIATVNAFALAITSGTAQTITPFAGVFCSEEDNHSLRQLIRQALQYGLVLIAAVAGVLVLFPRQVCGLFKIVEPELLALAQPALMLFAVSLLPALVNYLLIGFNQANRRTLLANALTVSRSFAGVVLFALLFWRILGQGSVWLCFLAAELLTLGVYLLAAAAYSRKHAYISPVLLLDTEAEKKGAYIAFAVANTPAAAAESAEKITEFCAANSLSPKTTMTIGLALEELLDSFNSHALSQGADFSNVRILIVGEHVILRIRCGGQQFDPVAYCACAGEGLDSDSLGIRMIAAMAKSIHYQHTFGVNNLTILI